MKDFHKRVAEEYLVDLKKAAAWERAGGSPNSPASVTALFKDPEFLDYVELLKLERQARTGIDADYLLKELAAMQQADPIDLFNDDHSLKPLSEWPVVWRRMLNGLEVVELFAGKGDKREQIGELKKLKIIDRNKILENLGKHISVQAFRDQVGLGNPDGSNLELTETERAARVAGLIDKAKRRMIEQVQNAKPDDVDDLV